MSTFEQAALQWRDLADLRLSVEVWRYTDAHGDRRPYLSLVAKQGNVIEGMARVPEVTR